VKTEILLVPDCHHRPPHEGAPCGMDFQFFDKNCTTLNPYPFFQRTCSTSAVVPIFTVVNGLSSTSSKKSYRPVIFHLGQFSRTGYQSLLSSNFTNSNFGKLTFLAFFLLAHEMLSLVSCLVGFKKQLPIRTKFASNSSPTAISLFTPASTLFNCNSNSRVFCSRNSSCRVLLLTSN